MVTKYIHSSQHILYFMYDKKNINKFIGGVVECRVELFLNNEPY
jgi:hypothetical protein